MNYLAHLFLGSGGSDHFLAGNLAGDFIRGKLPDTMNADVVAGIRLHRSIDAFTDSHAAVANSRRRLTAEFGHHSRIIVDVFADHFLAVSWSDFSDHSLQQFANRAYARLQHVKAEVPAQCATVIDRMTEGDWLTGYADVDSIERALFFLSRRLKRHHPLERAVRLLNRDRGAFEEDFAEYFPDVVSFAAEFSP